MINPEQTVDVRYVDDDVILINKPSMLSVLLEGWEPTAPCLINQLRKTWPDAMVVHRLDKDTSGIMVFARNPNAHRNLSIQFEKHLVLKQYLAVVVGEPSWDVTTAKHRLRVGVGKKHRTVVDNAKGISAETVLRVLDRFNGHAIVAAEPHTGRTHQIRVHLYAKGFPILGDPLYGEVRSPLIGRAALHANTIRFSHPGTNEVVTFEAPLADDIVAAIEAIKKS